MWNSQFKGQTKPQPEPWAGSCARLDQSEQNIPKSSPASETNMHISVILAAAHTNTPPPLHAQSRWSLPCNQIHLSPTDWQFDLWHWCWAQILAARRKGNHSIITFNGFIPLPQQCCRPGMALMCCLVSGSACFMWMMEAWGRLISKRSPMCWQRKHRLFHVFLLY